MALSNILKEPRREITEQLVGTAGAVALVLPPLALDYGTIRVIDYMTGGETHGVAPWIASFVVVTIAWAVAITLLIVLALAIHAFGEFLCDLADGMGLRLRPRRPTWRTHL